MDSVVIKHVIRLTPIKNECSGADTGAYYRKLRKNKYLIKLFLSNLGFYKNCNYLTVAKVLNGVFLNEFICALTRVEGLYEDDWCLDCPVLKTIREMGYRY